MSFWVYNTIGALTQGKQRHALPGCVLHSAFALLLSAAVSFAEPSPVATNDVASIALQGYTNHAGHVISGVVISANAKNVTLSLASGTKRVLPLSIFPPSERERIGIASGTLPTPPALVEAFGRCRLALGRIDVLVQAGQQSEEDAQNSRALEREAVRAIIADLKKKNMLSASAAAYFAARVP